MGFGFAVVGKLFCGYESTCRQAWMCERVGRRFWVGDGGIIEQITVVVLPGSMFICSAKNSFAILFIRS